jgi:DNA-binding PadR family transcriptional regulator
MTGFGYTQKLVLRLLASGDSARSVRQLANDWPGLTESAVFGALGRLARRGLVDVAGWDDYERRTYRLTEKGIKVERELTGLDAEDEADLAELRA